MSGPVFIHLTRLEFVSLLRTKCINKVFGRYYGDPIESLVQRVEQNCRPSRLNYDCPRASFSRIVMGVEKAEPGQWPFIAALQLREPRGDEKLFCGGNLVTSRHVLTGEQ